MSYDPQRPVPPKRDIAISIILTIVTCGIYDFVWDYKMGQEIRQHSQRLEINPGLDIFFMIITCYIYYFFWLYKMGRIMRDQEMACYPGEQPRMPEPWLLVIAAIFGATVVSDAIMQYEMNEHWGRHERAA